MRQLFCFVSLLALTGCGGSDHPLTAGDKPVEFWTREVRSGDARARKKAAFKLGNLGVADPSVLPALIEALNDRDATVRAEAVLALRKIGPTAQDAVPALTQAQTDRNALVRAYATKALEQIKGKG